MKARVPQGQSVCVDGIWYNQGDEVEINDIGSVTDIIPVVIEKPKNKEPKKVED